MQSFLAHLIAHISQYNFQNLLIIFFIFIMYISQFLCMPMCLTYSTQNIPIAPFILFLFTLYILISDAVCRECTLTLFCLHCTLLLSLIWLNVTLNFIVLVLVLSIISVIQMHYSYCLVCLIQYNHYYYALH